MPLIQGPWTAEEECFEAPVRNSAFAGLSTAISNSFAANPLIESTHVRQWQNDPFNPWIDSYETSRAQITPEMQSGFDVIPSRVAEPNAITGTAAVRTIRNLNLGQSIIVLRKDTAPSPQSTLARTHYFPLFHHRSAHWSNRQTLQTQPDVVFVGDSATVLVETKFQRPTLRDEIISAAVRWLPGVLNIDFEEEIDPEDGEKIPVVVVSTTARPFALIEAEPELFGELARKGRSSEWAKYAISYRYR